MINVSNVGKFALFLALPLLLVHCSGRARVKDPVGEKSKYSVDVLDDADLSFLTAEDVILLDCRDARSFSLLRLRGSENITLDIVRNSADRVMSLLRSKNKNKIVVYCYSKTCGTA
jgi:hypothetical protein